MMRRLAAAAASAALLLAFGATTAHATQADPAEFVTVSGPMTVHDLSGEDEELWYAAVTLECPEDTVAVSGGADLAAPWELGATWHNGRTWAAETFEVTGDQAPEDTEDGDSVGTAYAVCLHKPA
ncbi:hypothetical protein ACIA8O_37200 [Kitasatospora sp. NPDC051853]|uniref:hypothetical protein n=1 Tax=Kitasatospora sp. NPDC051853 TaxID=3364058 RepID=UPI0037AE1973